MQLTISLGKTIQNLVYTTAKAIDRTETGETQ